MNNKPSNDHRESDLATACSAADAMRIKVTYNFARLIGCNPAQVPQQAQLKDLFRLCLYERSPITLLLAYERCKHFIKRKFPGLYKFSRSS